MSKKLDFWVIFGQPLLSLLHLLNSSPIIAQIVPDATLPVNSSVQIQDNTSIITRGTKAGGNQFHSFEKFSIPTGGTAYFNNALDIQNIISRVTGSSISNIDGLIKANGTANLFLLNPNGMIFGSNARLSIGGSFIGSTASAVNFADGTQFSATTPQTTPLLTINVPLGLQFGGNPGAIRVQGTGNNLVLESPIFSPFARGSGSTGLQVNPGKNLALIGGDITLEGGNLEVSGGRIELGSVEKGVVRFAPATEGWTLDYESVPSFKDIQLFQQSLVDASGIGSGSIHMQGAHLILTDGSVILIQNQGKNLSGNISVNASESLVLTGTSLQGTISTSLISETVKGNGGNIEISTKKLILQGGASIATKTYSAGRGGDLNVNASNSTELLGASPGSLQIPSNIVTANFGFGAGGDLILSTGSLTLQEGAEMLTATYSTGRGGDLNVNTSKFIQVLGYLSGSFPFSSSIATATYGLGSGGNLLLSTGSLTAKDGGIVGSATTGSGKGGNVTVNANNFVELVGVVPSSFTPSILQAGSFGSGDAGRLTVNTTKLTVLGGGQIGTSTTGSGKAGNLTINASESVKVSGRVPGSVNPSIIDSSANILDKKLQDLYNLFPVPSGASGKVTINTGRLNVADGGLVSVRNNGSGDAGALRVNARSVFLDNFGGITAATASGEGGNIFLQAEDLQLRDNSIITATAGGTGNGGNITIDTNTLAALENSDITANAQGGTGGRVTINAQGLFLSPSSAIAEGTARSAIAATSQLGPQFNGTVQINSPDVDPSRGLVNLPEIVVDVLGLIAQECPGSGGNVGSSDSEFIITGRGGLPPHQPGEPLQASAILVNGEAIETGVGNSSARASSKISTSSNPSQIVEAQGWVINSKGEVVLTAYPPSVTPYSSSSPQATCYAP